MPATPRQLLLYRFDVEANYEGRLVGALERMESGGALRIVEALFVSRDADSGELAALDLRSRGAGNLVSPLIGFRLDAREGRAPPRRRSRARAATRSARSRPRSRPASRSRRCSSSTRGRGRSRTRSRRPAARRLSGGLVEADSLADLTHVMVAAAGGA